MSTLTRIPAATIRNAEGRKAAAPGARVRSQASTLRINEIFFSLQGESSRVGLPTVFVRLTGCPLRCGYCDTAYAFHDGKTQLIDDVIAEAALYPSKYICVTGGEPLAQKNCLALLTRLCDLGYSVSLETSGALDISAVDHRVSRIVDIKTPGSGEVDKNHWENLALLKGQDEIKLVITSEADYRWAVALLEDKKWHAMVPVLLSPAFNEVSYEQLAGWILRDGLKVRMQVQLHKIIWGEQRGV